MMAGSLQGRSPVILHLKYVADIWVSVDIEAVDMVDVVVDESSMAHPVAAQGGGGEIASADDQQHAERIAGGIEWPSWDYSPDPMRGR